MTNPYFDNGPFMTFKSAEIPKVEVNDPIFGLQDYSDWAQSVTPDGGIIVKVDIVPPSVEEEVLVQSPQAESKPVQMKTSLSDNKKKALNFFMSKGLELHQAAGLVGNLIRESGLNPNALNKNGGAFGIAQWLGSRKTNLISKYGKNPTFDQQLEYIWDELNSTHKTGLKMLKSSKNVTEAAANAFGWFEFSVGPQNAIREMNKYGQAGQKSYDQGIKFAKELLEDAK